MIEVATPWPCSASWSVAKRIKWNHGLNRILLRPDALTLVSVRRIHTCRPWYAESHSWGVFTTRSGKSLTGALQQRYINERRGQAASSYPSIAAAVREEQLR